MHHREVLGRKTTCAPFPNALDPPRLRLLHHARQLAAQSIAAEERLFMQRLRPGGRNTNSPRRAYDHREPVAVGSGHVGEPRGPLRIEPRGLDVARRCAEPESGISPALAVSRRVDNRAVSLNQRDLHPGKQRVQGHVPGITDFLSATATRSRTRSKSRSKSRSKTNGFGAWLGARYNAYHQRDQIAGGNVQSNGFDRVAQLREHGRRHRRVAPLADAAGVVAHRSIVDEDPPGEPSTRRSRPRFRCVQHQ
jgi:hypothetical protein